MTVSNTTNRWEYTGNGVTDTFAFTSMIFAKSDLVVYVAGVLQVVDVDYTVAGFLDDAGGSVTFVTPPASAASVVIERSVPYQQPTVYQRGDDFPSSSHETALDRVTVLAQQAIAAVVRTLRQQAADVGDIGELPLKAARASQLLGFDANGDPEAVAGTVDALLVSSFIETLLDDASPSTARATLAAMQDVITTRGDLVRGSAGGAAERLALGAAGKLVGSDGTDLVYLDPALPKGYFNPGQAVLSRDAGDVNHDVNVTAFSVRDKDDTTDIVLAAEITKQLDAAWAAGDDAGGLDIGAIAGNTWYFAHGIKNSTSGAVDVLLSASLAAPTMPTGYDKRRLLGAVLTNGSSQVLPFKQWGNWFWWVDPPLDVNSTTIGTSATLAALSVPPGLEVRAQLTLQATAGQAAYHYVSPPAVNDEAPADGTAPLATLRANAGESMALPVLTNTSKQVRLRASAGSQSMDVVTLGYELPRWDEN